MKPKVYIETSIPSFYCETRTEPDMLSRRQWTREWWDTFGKDYLLVTSVAVLDELGIGDYPNKSGPIALVSRLPLLAIEPAIAEIAQTYIQHKVMPTDPVGDALHLAIASYHKCDFLLTWNCRHLANANKVAHIRRINVILGLYIPLVVTPLELMGGSNGIER
jgi:hypothetical protein